MFCLRQPEAEFLDEIQTRVFRVFLLAIHSHLYSFALRFLLFNQPLIVSSVKLLYTVKEKGGKPYPLSNGLRNPYRNLKSEELSRLCPETLTKLYVYEFGFLTIVYTVQARLEQVKR
jgi:hypothetical protein